MHNINYSSENPIKEVLVGGKTFVDEEGREWRECEQCSKWHEFDSPEAIECINAWRKEHGLDD
jgi:hypothetical protein